MPGRHRSMRRIVAASLLTTLFAVVAGDAARAAPPSNDGFAQRTTVVATPYTDLKNNNEASLEPSEQQPQSGDCYGWQITGTVWYQYTPPVTVSLQADTLGSDFDTMLAIWTGGAIGGLAEVACNDQAGFSNQSRVVASLNAGTPYLFQVGGWEGESGSLRFNLGPAPPLGAISGNVHADGGGALPGICVDVYEEISGDYAYTLTDGAGNYRLTGLTGGSYIVEFYDDCDDSTDYAYEIYNDTASYDDADPVVVTPPDEVTGIDAGLALGGHIAGKVTDATTGKPVEEVCVNVVPQSGESFGFGFTGGDGRYRVGGLRSGNYRVAFFHCVEEPRYSDEWFENKAKYETADTVGVTAPQGVTIHAALIPSSGPIAKEIILRARPKRVERGDKFRLVAFVLPCAGEPGEQVVFFRGKRKLDTEMSGQTCRATTVVRARRTGSYRAVSPADGDQLEGTSKAVKVRVRSG